MNRFVRKQPYCESARSLASKLVAPGFALAAAIAATCIAPPVSSAQATLLNGYSYLEGLSIASRVGGASGKDLIVAGAGGGLLFLEHDTTSVCTSLPCTLVPESGLTVDREDTGGASFDIALDAQHAYVAAFRRGLVVFERGATTWSSQIVVGTEGAAAVAFEDMGNGRSLIAVGTKEDTAAMTTAPTGRFLVVEHDRSALLSATNPRIIYAESMGAPVLAVAASQSISAAIQIPIGQQPLAVIFGGSCISSGPGAPAPLQRRDLAYAAGSGGAAGTVGLVSSTHWRGDVQTSGDRWGRFVRDIVIDEGMQRAYVAAYFHGVYAFDVASTLDEDTRSGWPLALAGSSGAPVPGVVSSVDLDPVPAGVAARLIVGWGPTVGVETQYLGDCEAYACNGADEPREVAGSGFSVSTYVLDPTGLISHVNGVASVEAGMPPLGGMVRELTVRRPSSPIADEFFVDVASGSECVNVLRSYVASGGARTFELVAEFGKGDPPLLPLNTFDDLCIVERGSGSQLRRTLYVGAELGVAAFDVTNPVQTKLREGYSGFSPIPAIGVHALPVDDGSHRLYATNSAGRQSSTNPCGTPAAGDEGPGGGGLKAYDTSDRLDPKNPPNSAADAKIHKGGFGYMLRVVPGLDVLSSPADPSHYLYSVQEQKPWSGDSTFPVRFSVRVWDVGTVSQTRDPRNQCHAMTPSGLPDFVCTSDASGCPVCVQNPIIAPEPECLKHFVTSSLPETSEMQLEGIEVLPFPALGYHVVYVLYSQRPTSNWDPLVGPAGLLVLKLTGGTSNQLEYVTKVRAWMSVDSEHRPVRVSYDPNPSDPSHPRIYGAWTTGGVAVFDATDSLAPTLLARKKIETVSATGLRRAPLHALAGPVGSSSGKQYVYVAEINDGVDVYVLEPTPTAPLPFDLAFVRAHPMRFQTMGIAYDPSDASRRTLYTVQARCGLDRVRFDAALFN